MEDSWPNTNWREALIAALDPDGSPPQYVVPALNYDYLKVEEPLNVIVLQLGSHIPYRQYYRGNANMIRFLNASSHNVIDWEYYSEAELYYLLEEYPESIDAIVIPNVYDGILLKDTGSSISTKGCCQKKGNCNCSSSDIPTRNSFGNGTQVLLRNFVSEGGNLVAVGNGNAQFLSSVFYQELNNFYARHFSYYYSEFIFPYGYDFRSAYRENSLFSEYYLPGETLPYAGSFNALYHSIQDQENYLQYCTYVFPAGNTRGNLAEYNRYDDYCAVWSKGYGDGHISAIANDFGTR